MVWFIMTDLPEHRSGGFHLSTSGTAYFWKFLEKGWSNNVNDGMAFLAGYTSGLRRTPLKYLIAVTMNRLVGLTKAAWASCPPDGIRGEGALSPTPHLAQKIRPASERRYGIGAQSFRVVLICAVHQ